MDKKILISYFSWSGNTKHIAETIHSKIGGDIFRIETKEEYPADYNETAYGIAKEQHDKHIHPELKNNGDISDYDVIFIGTPAWWYTMAPAVMTFIEKAGNFEGKTIVPFITHGGGGKYNIAEEIREFSKTEVCEPLVVFEKGTTSLENEIENWLKNIAL